MDPSNFRLRLALDLWRTIAVPSLAFVAVIRFSKWNPGWLSLPVYISFMILSTIARRQWTLLSQHREARQLGAAPIPRVVGKWPGNIDILLQMMRDFKNSYTLDVYLRLFEEYRSTTLNLRILWTDTIITMDQQHAKFALASGFNHFWRGKLQKERMWVINLYRRCHAHLGAGRPF